jgi:peroxiredoxin
MSTRQSIPLYPGYRSDFLVRAPKEEGEYLLTNEPVPAARAFREVRLTPTPLARVCVKGKPIDDMQLPKPDVIGKYALRPIEDKELVNRIPHPFEFNADDPNYTINDQAFDPGRIDVCPRLGTAEEWAVSSKQDQHPFHIHVNPFEVVQKDGKGNVVCRTWRDTVFFTAVDPPTYVRMRFEDFPGKTVLHCHNLPHEDQGMMMALRIVGKASPVPRAGQGRGLPKLSAPAPAWSLPDASGQAHGHDDLKGQDYVLVFYRGLACSHCRRQLEALAKNREALAAAKLKVIAVSPDAESALKEALKGEPRLKALPALLLSDEPLGVFRRFGCHDGGPLHGVFLIDARGAVRWQSVGDEPLLDIDDLLLRWKRALAEPRP